jgi:superfamily I DNA/RNA helicase
MIAAESWKPADGLTLEPNGLAAVKAPTSNIILTAGPGSGKTEVLAQT